MLKHFDKKNPDHKVKIGDLIFIHIPGFLFKQVSLATQCWSNHVGIVIGFKDGEPLVAESRVPLSSITTLSRFVRRSRGAEWCVRRTPRALSGSEEAAITAAARARLGRLYHTGFALHSRRQFCSKFVAEVLQAALGESFGETEDFAHLLARNTQVPLAFWKVWYFGRIPWQRQTITPASLFNCPKLHDASSQAGHRASYSQH